MRLHNRSKQYSTHLLLLILISTLIRAVLAFVLELSNDEAYYRVIALFPELTNFDHPPLVNLLINFTTPEHFTHNFEIYVRLFSVIIGAINTYLIYLIAKSPIFNSKSSFLYNNSIDRHSPRRGYIAALLYTASIYCTIISGTFIMPDTPLSLFWLLTLLIFSRILFQTARFNSTLMLLAGIMIGLAMLSKYTGGYLWVAALLYILLYNRSIFKQWSLYISILLTIAVFSPIIIWNFQNDFVSLTMHSERISNGSSINWLYLFREVLGSAFYNGIFNYLLIITSFLAYYLLGRRYISRDQIRFLICFSIPMVLIFLIAALTRPTLPHWSAPAYYALIILAAAYLSSISRGAYRRWMTSTILFTIIVITLGVCQINYGLFDLSSSRNTDDIAYGSEDPSLDMYGWSQLADKFHSIYSKDKELGIMPSENVILVATTWFEASHLESYIGCREEVRVVVPLEQSDRNIFFSRLSSLRVNSNFASTEPFYLIVSGKFFKSESPTLSLVGINESTPYEIIPIERQGKLAHNFVLYRINPIDVQEVVIDKNLSELNTLPNTTDSLNNQNVIAADSLSVF